MFTNAPRVYTQTLQKTEIKESVATTLKNPNIIRTDNLYKGRWAVKICVGCKKSVIFKQHVPATT